MRSGFNSSKITNFVEDYSVSLNRSSALILQLTILLIGYKLKPSHRLSLLPQLNQS